MGGPFSNVPIEGAGGGGGAGVSGLTTADGGTALADNAVVRGDGTTGIQGSDVTIADTTGAITQPAGGYIVAGNGTTSNPSLAFVGDPDSGIYLESAGTIGLVIGGNRLVNLNATRLSTVGLPLQSGVLVEASTATSGSPNVLATFESGLVLTNEGATAANYHTLPSAVAGKVFEFIVQDADGIRVVAAASDTIRVIDKVTAAAGYIESTTIGSTVRLVSVNAVEWYAASIHGVWTDGTWTYDDTGNTSP